MVSLKRKPKFKVGDILQLYKGFYNYRYIYILDVHGTFYRFIPFEALHDSRTYVIDQRGIEVVEDTWEATVDETKTTLYGRGHRY